MKGANNTYFGNIKEAVSSLLYGLKLSFQHFRESTESRKPMGIDQDDYFEQATGLVTLQYPKESLPVPDNGRYRLHNEIEDCIVCDKCAKICPVNCIEIEPVKAVEEIGKTSDGTSKRLYAAKFDIDMGKCCFCGLCTTVCPTECLTMTKAYDFSEYDVADHIYAFAEMTPIEILQKKQELDAFNRQKEVDKAAKAETAAAPKPAAARPRPAVGGVKSAEEGTAAGEEANAGGASPAGPKPAFRPRVKPKNADPADLKGGEAARPKPSPEPMEKEAGEDAARTGPKPAFRPKIKPPASKSSSPEGAKPVIKPEVNREAENQGSEIRGEQQPQNSAGARPRPVMKPKISAKEQDAGNAEVQQEKPSGAKPRPVMRPKIKAKESPSDPPATEESPKEADILAKTTTGARPRPVMKPKIKAAGPADNADAEKKAPAKPVRPVIRPKIQPPSAKGDGNKGEEKGAPSEETKKGMPVVKPTGVPHNPTEDEKSESDKKEEQKVKPGNGGKSQESGTKSQE